VFERFNSQARNVVVVAQEEARTLQHSRIDTEHILLGLLRETNGLAAQVLGSYGLTVEKARAEIVRLVAPGEEVTTGQRQIPFTPRVKKILELALREALALKHTYIGPEHILLALVGDNEGVAIRVLVDLEADPERIYEGVIRQLPQPEGYRDDADLGRLFADLVTAAEKALEAANEVSECYARGSVRFAYAQAQGMHYKTRELEEFRSALVRSLKQQGMSGFEPND
jgi:ATP-dependent Clp protease ATP-binding subunit ClpA